MDAVDAPRPAVGVGEEAIGALVVGKVVEEAAQEGDVAVVVLVVEGRQVGTQAVKGFKDGRRPCRCPCGRRCRRCRTSAGRSRW